MLSTSVRADSIKRGLDMESLLRKIEENTGPKFSFQVVLNGKGSRIETIFSPEIAINPGCHYEIAFASLETYYSFPNIDIKNNTLKIYFYGKWHDFEIPVGCYELTGINAELQRQMKLQGAKEVVKLEPNLNTFKCIMTVPKDMKVDFKAVNSLKSVLGFDSKIYGEGRITSPNTVNIMSVNSVFVHCDLVGSSYLNSKRAPIIYSFFPDREPGEKIIQRPNEYIYLPVASDVIRRMSVWLTDQDQNPLNLRGETLTCKFHLRSC